MLNEYKRAMRNNSSLSLIIKKDIFYKTAYPDKVCLIKLFSCKTKHILLAYVAFF